MILISSIVLALLLPSSPAQAKPAKKPAPVYWGLTNVQIDPDKRSGDKPNMDGEGHQWGGDKFTYALNSFKWEHRITAPDSNGGAKETENYSFTAKFDAPPKKIIAGKTYKVHVEADATGVINGNIGIGVAFRSHDVFIGTKNLDEVGGPLAPGQESIFVGHGGGGMYTHASADYEYFVRPDWQDKIVFFSSAEGTLNIFIYEKGKKPIGDDETPPPPSSEPGRLRVGKITGEAMYLHGRDEWADLKEGMILLPSDQVSTGPDSAVDLVCEDDFTWHIKDMTQLRMRQLLVKSDRIKVELYLKIGELKAQVKRQETISTDFSIKTPTATVSVRGTVFTTRVEKDGSTTVWVDEGVVLVAPDNPKLKPVKLYVGQKVTVTAKGISPVTTRVPG